MLEVIDDNNGLALYNLILFRLQDIKASDPLARAIQLKMNLQHIRYVPKPHGVAKYFALIDSHRTELASLNRPKVIEDWEVVTKALQDLPPLHPQFQKVAELLAIQRKLFQKETTLPVCRAAFINADNEHDIHGDLTRNKHTGKKRKLLTNFARADKRPHKSNVGGKKFNKGDCGHHPNSISHCTEQCMNPFGIRSIFGKAKTYAEKCAAVKRSIALGWSPKATNVRIPTGFNSTNSGGPSNPPTPSVPLKTTTQPPALKTNYASTDTNISPNSARTYQRVKAIIESTSSPIRPPSAYNPLPTTPTLASPVYRQPVQTNMVPHVPITQTIPIRAYHTTLQSQYLPQPVPFPPQQPTHQQPIPQYVQQTVSHHPFQQHLQTQTPIAPRVHVRLHHQRMT